MQGVLDATGALVERYEYEPYGARRVYVSAGSNDPLAMTPADRSTRVKLSDGAVMTHGLNPFGHQGLMHDDASGLVYNRARMLHTTLATFSIRDALRYVDGMGFYQYLRTQPIRWVDPLGYEVSLQSHLVAGENQHLSLRIIPENQEYVRE